MIGKTITHYKILEKLGGGGMGVVYKAEDTKLGRTVALKFLPPSFSSDEEAKKRFINEAQSASILDHPNICTVYEIGETEDLPDVAGGKLFISMACYEGETLKDKIVKGPIEIDEAIKITLQICEGLEKAHKKGIVHRDIKPANIFITTDGIVKILDFGLAKSKSQTQLTQLGSTLGTVDYMSPEQANGNTVDKRTDIWSVGVVLYEMITGKRPFAAKYEQAVIYSILNEEPLPISTQRFDAPIQLARIISKALEKDNTKRYLNIRDLYDDLTKPKTSSIELPKYEKSIVVLPFKNISPDQDQEYFSDGLTEEIIIDLAAVKSLRVISRSSSMTFKGTKKKIPEIAREVNVQYVLEGSVRKSGNKLRIIVQLIDAYSDANLWAEKYNNTLDDIFDIQEQVAKAVFEALRIKLTSQDAIEFKEQRISNIDAYDYYLRARDQIHKFDVDAIHRAVEYLKRAQTLVGDSDIILSGLAYAYAHIVNLGLEQDEYVETAEKYAQKALELNPNSAEALTVLGFVSLWFRGNSLQALYYLEKAVRLRSDDPNTLMWLSVTYAQVGKIEDARGVAARTIEVDPLTTLYQAVIGTIELYAGRFEHALEYMEHALEGEPENPMLQVFFTIALFYSQKQKQLRNFVLQHADRNRGTSVDLLMILLSDATDKQVEKMHALLQRPETMSTFRRDSQWSWFTASAFACAGDYDTSLEWIENAVNRGFLNEETFSLHDPFLSLLKNDPRFEKLIEKLRSERKAVKVQP